MMWPHAAIHVAIPIPFYVVRIAEMRPVLIAVAAATTIAILISRKPQRSRVSIAAIIVVRFRTSASKCIRWSTRHMFDAVR